jgi:hypothetical protein
MVMSPLSTKPVLVFEFGFWFDMFSTLVEIGGLTSFPHTLLEVCPAHKDKVEIKCMGSFGGKTPTEPKLYFSSLSLDTLNNIKLMLCALFIYMMGDKIKRLSMNVAFEDICPKGLNCLTHERIVHKVLIFTRL